MKLDQFLKWRGLALTGGQAKRSVQAGEVRVNGSVETRRGRELNPGDAVECHGERVIVPVDNGGGAGPVTP
ncbi:RNA-binding S4 domain-containing protein [Synechococcus sp. RSCCF101]|uniref:RNA-binding S4 domain-containing protein n=1 Tax=Synechococcus sp. RSCCF101 TaxID=2511069 RepID=UPI001245019C|nr:RNA-binding S4 domain-containing protein [Synechococcus sp. RSCCF101]QEY31877.1 RNA-binding S4 domain-containing protein [Synechococcus sp. RSCCF101]